MGNHVVFAVSHAHPASLAQQSFDACIDTGILRNAAIPRTFDEQHSNGISGVAVAHYNHRDDPKISYISSQGVFQNALFSLAPLATLSKTLPLSRGNVRYYCKQLQRFFSPTLSLSPAPETPHEPLMLPPHAISIFGFNTDDLSRLSAIPDLMVTVTRYLKDPKNTRLPHALKPLCTLTPDQAVFVHLGGNAFVTQSAPSNAIDLAQLSELDMEEIRGAFAERFLNAMGYLIRSM
jgi:hypothetical protein